MDIPRIEIDGQSIDLSTTNHDTAWTVGDVPLGDAILHIGPASYKIRVTRAFPGSIKYVIYGSPAEYFCFVATPYKCRICQSTFTGLCISDGKSMACGSCQSEPIDGQRFTPIPIDKTADRPDEAIRADIDRRTTEGARRRNGQAGYSGGDGMTPIYRKESP